MTENIAAVIDHTLLKPDATQDAIDQLISEALKYEFASVCVHPYWVGYCYDKLKASPVKICTVVGFPLGANTIDVKVFETQKAIEAGATEIDMVINIGALKMQADDYVQQEISEIVMAAEKKACVKVIIETALLTNEEKKRACHIAQQAGADFVKTSTGFSGGGATIADIKLMRATVGSSMGVKASGGIRSLEDLQAMLAAGASRIGASSSVVIMAENNSKKM